LIGQQARQLRGKERLRLTGVVGQHHQALVALLVIAAVAHKVKDVPRPRAQRALHSPHRGCG
jgi:hypothetical protein